MIIHTGLRTDIPAFYSKWFANRLRAGEVMVRNPYNRNQVTRYILDPELVDLIVFCTKNPSPMLRYTDLLKPYGQYWFVTITPYGTDIEPHVPQVDFVIDAFKKMSSVVGDDCMALRYDPVFISKRYSMDYHLYAFEYIVKELKGYTHDLVISFIDLFDKTVKNFPEVKAVSKEERLYLGERFCKIARDNDMVLRPCGEGDELFVFGADCSGCMTGRILSRAKGVELSLPDSGKNRRECSCYLTCDIGQYNSCPHLCRYCYANYSVNAVRNSYALHNENSPLLIGNLEPQDRVTDAIEESFVKRQTDLFDFVSV